MTDGRDASQSAFNITPSDNASSYMVHLLLPCDEGDHLLAEIGPENNARLPSIRIPIHGKKYFSKDVLERKVEEAFPFPVCLVKRKYNYKEEDIENPGHKILQEIWIVHAADDFPPMTAPLQWIHEDDAFSYEWPNAIRSFTAGHVTLDIRDLFEDISVMFETRAKPWEALGFYKKLMSWSRAVLRNRNMIMEGRIRLLEDSGEGRILTCAARGRDDECVDRATGGKELIFIKCTLPVAREVERTMAVASVFGDIVPEIFGFDAKRGVLMMRNAGKVTDEPFDREVLIGTVLRMQRVSLKHIPELQAKGLRVMDTEWLESKVESILNHVIFEEFFAFLEECKSTCEDEREMIKSLRSKIDELRHMCRQITKVGLPNTIVHGDCHEDNIGRSTMTRDGKVYRIFDWSNCHIGSPLVDLDKVLPTRPKDVMSPKDWEAGVRQVCEEWKQLACLTYAEVRKAFDNMGCLQLLFEVYKLEEQFDLYMARAKEDDEFELELSAHQMRIFVPFEDLVHNLGDANKVWSQWIPSTR